MDKKMIAQSAALVAACTASVVVAGCSVKTPENADQVSAGTSGSGSPNAATASPNGSTTGTDPFSPNTAAAQMGERVDPKAEEVIGDESLKAWRTAIAHQKQAAGQSETDWKKQRVADETKAMAMLDDLANRYPHASTVFFMMGQVEENLGKNKEAVTFYAKSREKNTFSPLSLFKLAENERLSGNLKDATQHFQKLYQLQPSFYPGRLGLAQCVKHQNPGLSAMLAQSIIDEDKEDPSAVEKAKQILSETKSGEASY